MQLLIQLRKLRHQDVQVQPAQERLLPTIPLPLQHYVLLSHPYVALRQEVLQWLARWMMLLMIMSIGSMGEHGVTRQHLPAWQQAPCQEMQQELR